MREEFLLLWVLSSASDLDGEVAGWGGGQVRSGGKCAGKGAAGGVGGGAVYKRGRLKKSITNNKRAKFASNWPFPP